MPLVCKTLSLKEPITKFDKDGRRNSPTSKRRVPHDPLTLKGASLSYSKEIKILTTPGVPEILPRDETE